MRRGFSHLGARHLSGGAGRVIRLLVREWAQRSNPVHILFSDEPLAAVRTDKGRDLSLIDPASDRCGVDAQSPTSVS